MPVPTSRNSKKSHIVYTTAKSQKRNKIISNAVTKVQKLLKQYPNKSIRQICLIVSQEENINSETLRISVLRKQKSAALGERRHGSCLLSKEEEEAVVGMILGFDIASLPLHDYQVKSSIKSVFKKQVSDSWITRFKKRHASVLASRVVKPIQTCRLKTASVEIMKDWLQRLDIFLKSHRFPAHARFNIDETRVVSSASTRAIVGTSRSKKNNKNNTRQSRNRSLGTCVPFINAEGNVFMSFYILKDKNEAVFKGVIPRDERGRGTWPRRYAISKTGWMNKSLFSIMMNDFADRWNLIHQGLDCIVFLDNCSPHRSDSIDLEEIDANLVLRLAKKGIWLFFFPPYTTAWLQPLDDVAFGLFKRLLGRKKEQLCFSTALLMNRDGEFDLDHAVEAETRAFTKQSIIRSWINTGMSQENDFSKVDDAKILARAKEVFGEDSDKTVDIIQLAAEAARAVIDQTPPVTIGKQHQIPVSTERTYNAIELLALAEKEDAKLKEKQLEKAEREERETKEKEEKRASRLAKKKEEEIEKERKRVEREANRDAKRREREDSKLSNRCRKCNKIWKGHKGWLECEHCSSYAICVQCLKFKPLVTKHEKNCKAKRQKSD